MNQNISTIPECVIFIILQKAAEARDEGQAASTAAQKKDHELREKDETITKQLKILRGKEKQIAEVSMVKCKYFIFKKSWIIYGSKFMSWGGGTYI